MKLYDATQLARPTFIGVFKSQILNRIFDKIVSYTHTSMQYTNGVVCVECNGSSKDRATTPVFKVSLEGLHDQVDAASRLLVSQQLVGVPTDTIYGIAGLAQSSAAILSIYKIKGRDLMKPISICVAEIEDIYRWAHVTVSQTLLQRLLPGPVTVVFERSQELNPSLNAGTTLVGVRIPDNAFVRELSRREPLALTSANLSGEPSCLNIQEFEHLWPKLGAVFDGGQLSDTPSARLGSTVVNLSVPGNYSIIRPGSSLAETVKVLEEHGLKAN